MSATRNPGTWRREIADARERFLTQQDISPDIVRQPILASWSRSHRRGVEADHIDLPFVDDLDTDSPLVTAAAPILRELGAQLQSEPVSILLTDAQGVVLDRVDSDPAIARYLDRVDLAPGFSYAERFVGTNGIGTALDEGRPTLVQGPEHYAENLERLACAGVPIKHPVRGTVLGALDLTSWAGESAAMMQALAGACAERIERGLLNTAGLTELALFREYLRTSQRTNGVVLAVNGDVVMMNERARRTLSPADQHSLMEWAADVRGEPGPVTLICDLPSGLVARLGYRPVEGRRGQLGGVVEVRFSRQPVAARPRRDVAALPGLVGGSGVWQRCVAEVENCYRQREWVVLSGESGTGKLALLRAVRARHDPAGHFRVMSGEESADPTMVDAWLDAVSGELSGGGGVLVIRHADRLSPEALTGLGSLLQASTDCWVALTVTGADDPGVATHLLPHFPHTVTVPSLRHHSEDVPELVTSLMAGLARGHRLRFGFDAMQQLIRSPWPGNVTQLRSVLIELLAVRRSGTVHAGDLPAQARSAIRRQLSPIEALERDAIVRSLTTHGGNKTRASAELGMSRATIYRKIRDYGISGV
ncbi:sigma-54-dependent Fis family transcriptional regulator [Kineosporia succinea]|uniref:Transcriptional regulator of acetoin/glycerol metabolism n=1 Tax=Kineosporia succinea TaxID=84632 RepID=A0ABT9P4X6_9ACTN|nr:GAF domain-containing protein [Kineosporia succinea]MDP9827743.1 transcriptional regulator of acetoin/glycerol metabolism [Kineosporia succinea]